ncbi:MAG: RDD family protein [Verrucomicrobia bacterium]|nr:RDD family protein [Verrucomicrobiota bacterium]
MPWYYANNDQRLGPVNDTEFARLAREKIIREETLVWQHGMAEWKSYAEVAPTLPSIETPPPFSGEQAQALDVEAILAEHPVELPYASFWARAGAKIVDLIILNFLVLITAVLMNKMPVVPADAGFDELRRIFAEFSELTQISIGIELVFTWFFVWRFQGTPGKLLLGLKIVNADGSRVGPIRILFRFFGEVMNRIMFCLGYLFAAADDEKRTMHDFLADTRVVYKKRQ